MDGAAQTLVNNTGQLLAAEYGELRGVSAEIAELRDDLDTMNALLRMQSEADEGAVDHFVRVWMKQLREVAYDAEDCIDLYRLRIMCRPGDGVRDRFRHLLQTLFSRRRLAGEISVLRARAIAISERHARYGINREALRRPPSLSSATPMLTAHEPAHVLGRDTATAIGSEHERNQVVGIDGQVEALAKELLAGVDGQCHLKVLSIVGFAGLGKTTLALEICRRLEEEFPYQAIVSVSQAFEPGRDVRALLKRILQQIVKPKAEEEKGIKVEGSLGDIDGMDAHQLVTKLEETLKNKRCIIVIDDIWTIRAWEAIQSKLPKFPENKHDNIVIVTTRIETVAKACSPANVNGHHIHHMEPLKFEDSKKLFLSRAFGSIVASYPEELEDVMSNILRKCSGLPLAIVSIASVLAGYSSPGTIDKWRTICNSIGSQMESNPTLEGMRQIVTLSYNHLPHELKGCMMYFSMFPEDYEIEKKRLLRRWIAEGLVSQKRGLTLIEVAESYLDELVSRNLVEPCFGFDGNVASCRVHDMLLEVMVSRSLECNFISLLGSQYAAMSYERIRRLSVQGDDHNRPHIGDEQPKKKMARRDIKNMTDLEHVRSLSIFQLADHNLLDHLDKFTLLRVLDLEDCEGLTNHHMTYVCKLYLLKFLSVKGTNISKIPSQVGKLEHLQTLNTFVTCLTELPTTVTNLEKLECIEFCNKKDWFYMWALPQGLSKMKALREVRVARINRDDVEVARELGELQQLQSIALYIQEDVKAEVLHELALSLSKLYSVRSLDISHANIYHGDMSFLHNIPTPPRLLRYLRIEGSVLNGGLPEWVGSLTYLVEFGIMRAGLVGDQLFGVLCKLPNLKSIWMQRRCYNDNEIVARTSHNFPALVNLTVTCDETSLPRIFRFENGSMDKLETFKVNFTEEERSIIGMEHLTNLKEVELWGPRNSTSLNHALHQLKEENMKRSISNQIRVVVKYAG